MTYILITSVLTQMRCLHEAYHLGLHFHNILCLYWISRVYTNNVTQPFPTNWYNHKMENGEKLTCLEKHAFDVREMYITSIIACISMTHTICIVDV